MKSLKMISFALVFGVLGLLAVIYFNRNQVFSSTNSQAIDDETTRLIQENDQAMDETTRLIQENDQAMDEIEKLIREIDGEIKARQASSARMKDLLIIYGLQEIAAGQNVRRVYQYDNRKYLVGWLSYEAVTGELLGKSVFKYNNQGYLIRWDLYEPADTRIRQVDFQYDSSGYLIECIAETVLGTK